MIPVKKDGLWKYVDIEGNTVIDGEFEEAMMVHEGVAIVKENGKWKYIDKNGMPLFGDEFDVALHFTNGIATVAKYNPKKQVYEWGAINKKGEYVIPMTYKKLGLFRDGLIYAEDDYGCYYLNKKGKVVIDKNKIMANK